MSDLIKIPERITFQGTSTLRRPMKPRYEEIEISVNKITGIWYYPEADEGCVISLEGEVSNRLIALSYKEMIKLVASKL